jgi:hypothetical protein
VPPSKKALSDAPAALASWGRVRLYLLFAVMAGLSSVGTLYLWSRNDLVIWQPTGFVFAGALIAGVALTKCLGWWTIRLVPWRCLVAVACLGIAHPISLWLFNVAGIAFSRCSYNPICSANSSWPFLRGVASIFPALLAVLAGSVISLSLALWVFTGQWLTSRFLCLFFGAVIAIWNSFILSLVLSDFSRNIRISIRGEDWTTFAVLVLNGQVILSLISADWIMRVNESDFFSHQDQ